MCRPTLEFRPERGDRADQPACQTQQICGGHSGAEPAAAAARVVAAWSPCSAHSVNLDLTGRDFII